MNKEVSKVGVVVAIVAGVVILAGLAMYAYNGSGGNGNVGAKQVKDMQAEARSQVPNDLGTVPPEKAQAGLMTAGGQKGKY